MKKKKTTLELLQEKSGNAVKLITDTINELELTNEAIETEKFAIESQIAALREQNNSLSDLRDKNAHIVSNFKALLS